MTQIVSADVRRKRTTQSQRHLIWRRFKRHRLAVVGLLLLLALYVVGVFLPEFFAPYTPDKRFEGTDHPPQRIRFVDAKGRFYLIPFVYRLVPRRDPVSWKMTYSEDTSKPYPIRFFVRGESYRILDLVESDLHFLGVGDDGYLLLLGTDDLGRCMLSRTIYAMRVSLTIGFVGVFISLILGLIFGGLSGLVGGPVDNAIQRFIEVLLAIPKIPLWMALAAAIPRQWTAIQVYFAITIILSLMAWTQLARVVRSKFMALREEDFVTAAMGYNVSKARIILRHLIPNFISYVIVNVTLAIPAMIISETSLSFLGVGLKPPVVSLGVLLQRAQNFQTVILKPWLLIPGIFVVLTVLAFNFVGDGLRDAADPYD